MSKRRRQIDYGIPDVFGIGDRTYVITGPAEVIGGTETGLAEIKRRGAVKKVTLVVGLNCGVNTGRCRTQPRKYKVDQLSDTFVALRDGQLRDPEKVAATIVPARGTYKGSGETTRIIEVLYRPNKAERSFAEFKKNMLNLGETLSRRFCQEQILAVVKNGASEVDYEITPAPKRRRK